MDNKDEDFKKIAVIEDGSDLFKDVIPDTEHVDFEYLGDVDVNRLKPLLKRPDIMEYCTFLQPLSMFPMQHRLFRQTSHHSTCSEYIERTLEKYIEQEKLAQYDIENLDEIS